MFIKFNADASYVQDTPEQSRFYKAGETYEVTEDHGNRWIRRQVAEEVQAPTAPEPEPETFPGVTDAKPMKASKKAEK